MIWYFTTMVIQLEFGDHLTKRKKWFPRPGYYYFRIMRSRNLSGFWNFRGDRNVSSNFVPTEASIDPSHDPSTPIDCPIGGFPIYFAQCVSMQKRCGAGQIASLESVANVNRINELKLIKFNDPGLFRSCKWNMLRYVCLFSLTSVIVDKRLSQQNQC